MEHLKLFIHWSCYLYYLYVFGYASLFKVFQKKSMMSGMNELGFNKTWTILIGVGELIGVLLLVIGLFKPPVKNLGVLILIPFAIGAFTAHMAHREYLHYYESLLMCIFSILILLTDKHFRIYL